MKTKKKKKYRWIYPFLWSALFANMMALSIQYVSLLHYKLSLWGWLLEHVELYAFSAGIIFLLLLGVGALVNNFYFAIGIGALLVGALDYAQFQKLKILGEPVYPWDLQQLKQMPELLKIVSSVVPPALLVCALVLLILALWSTFYISRNRLKLPLRSALIILGILMLSECGHLQESVFAKPLEKLGAVDDHWDQQRNYLENGFVVGFLDNLGVKMESKPADYSEAAMQTIVQKYEAEASGTSTGSTQEQPNIVYVMDESLFDPTRLTDVVFSADPMANLHRYAGTYATGWSLSPTFGGGTSNVEFEALTGLNMSFLNGGAVPYQQILTQKSSFPSLVSMLKARGYETTAVHPFDKTFYNRNVVYPVLGFDKFISQDDFAYKDKLSDSGYISDLSAVKQVVDVLKSGDQPHFVHLVTMQNHLPITEGMNGPNTIQVSGIQSASGTTEMESYAQSVKETDAAVKYLVDAVQQLDRPTIVVVFGDHLPSLDNQTYSNHTGTLSTEQDEEFLHQTPLLVAANFPLQNKELGTIAPSFFGPMAFQLTGQSLPPYYRLLEDVRDQLPGIGPNLYVDAQGTASLNLTESQKNALHDYELVQYDLLYGNGYASSLLK